MGQATSTDSHIQTLSAEELSVQLADRFAHQCFNPLELYSFKDNFRTLADSEGGVLYWKEDTLVRFLELPEPLNVGGIIFQAASHLGAFPFESLVPAILDFGALVKVVALLTGRSKKVLKRTDRLKTLFRAFAVHERRVHDGSGGEVKEGGGGGGDVLVYDSDDGSEDLSLAALEALDAVNIHEHNKKQDIHHSHIPREHMKRLIMLLFVISPLEETQSLTSFAPRFSPESLESLDRTAESILGAFGPLKSGGITYPVFKKTIRNNMPFLFDQGLPALFSHFLFSKNVSGSTTTGCEAIPEPEPLLAHPGEILNIDTLSQLSLLIQGDRLWRRVRPLYMGSDDGFSMGSFETKVCKWLAPTILLISGTCIPASPSNIRERAFFDTLPPRKYPSSSYDDGRVVYGVFLETPWKISHKECFGDAQTILFQLFPVHRVWKASRQVREYAYFNKDDGIGFGSEPQGFGNSRRRSSGYFNIGPVSLVLEKGLEYGVFTNAGEGGAFVSAGEDDGRGCWQDRFEIEEVEVWGCGGESEAEAQRKAWQWEEREALLRRQINLGKDIEADRALLEMAGLIGQHISGGSM
ncbi:hypothetical protein K440DRAFT_603930 [Wilcoxina mikolae CBS 423.85]|nr:hypothetical protein K440DRAFT_603930 [Wilcoxina mikolae CBS 423.85]